MQRVLAACDKKDIRDTSLDETVAYLTLTTAL